MDISYFAEICKKAVDDKVKRDSKYISSFLIREELSYNLSKGSAKNVKETNTDNGCVDKSQS